MLASSQRPSAIETLSDEAAQVPTEDGPDMAFTEDASTLDAVARVSGTVFNEYASTLGSTFCAALRSSSFVARGLVQGSDVVRRSSEPTAD